MELKTSKLIRLKIMDLLSRREHSSKEIFNKLNKSVDLIEILNKEISKLEDEGLIDNKRYAEQYIHSRKNKGFGPLRIRNELIQRGIEQEISKSLLDSYDWTNLAQTALKKKLRKEFPKDLKETLKIKRFLEYRGFDYYQIEGALKLSKNLTND